MQHIYRHQVNEPRNLLTLYIGLYELKRTCFDCKAAAHNYNVNLIKGVSGLCYIHPSHLALYHERMIKEIDSLK